jgi:flagellar biogenesis protein FliO
MSLKSSRLFLCGILCIVAVVPHITAQNRQTGNFDIRKVQEAIKADSEDSLSRALYASPGDLQSEKTGESYTLVTLRIVGYLVLLSGIIFCGIWFVKKLGLAGTSRIGGGSMDLLEALPVGQNRSLILVRVMNVVYVLAQTPQQVTVLEKIDGDRAVELIASTKGGTSIVQFKEVFNNFLGKIKKTP